MSTPCGKGDDTHGMKCLRGLIGIFKCYACKDGDATHLSKSELKALLEKEFPMLLKDTTNPEEVNKTLAALDFDGDGQVDIQEYFVTLCILGLFLSIKDEKEGHCSRKC